MRTKMKDDTCLICQFYENCSQDSSEGCERYQYYKCETCIDRTVENDNVPKCFRGGIPCNHIRLCSNERRTQE